MDSNSYTIPGYVRYPLVPTDPQVRLGDLRLRLLWIEVGTRTQDDLFLYDSNFTSVPYFPRHKVSRVMQDF